MPPGQTFVGDWDSNWGKLKLMQNGKRVYGPYTGFRHGSISGEQDGDLLLFHWIQKENEQSGHGYLRLSPDGKTMEGRWGYLKSYDNGGSWSAKRGRPDSDSDS